MIITSVSNNLFFLSPNTMLEMPLYHSDDRVIWLGLLTLDTSPPGHHLHNAAFWLVRFDNLSTLIGPLSQDGYLSDSKKKPKENYQSF